MLRPLPRMIPVPLSAADAQALQPPVLRVARFSWEWQLGYGWVQQPHPVAPPVALPQPAWQPGPAGSPGRAAPHRPRLLRAPQGAADVPPPPPAVVTALPADLMSGRGLAPRHRYPPPATAAAAGATRG